MKTRGALLTVLALMLAGVLAGTWLQQRAQQQAELERQTAVLAGSGSSPASSTALFAARLIDPQGRTVALERWRGRTLVVNLWASWCHPCIDEMPELSDFYRQHPHKNFELIGIAIDNPTQVRAFLRQHPVDYPVLLGGSGGDALSRQLGDGVGALPYTVVIDPAGQVVWQHLGRIDVAALTAHLP